MPKHLGADDMSEEARGHGMVEALADAFREWWPRNAGAMEMGGTGDVYDLLLRLNAAAGAGVNGWLPIVSAPKDGTVVLLAGGYDDSAPFANDEEAANMATPCRGWWHIDGWLITLAEAARVGVTRVNPTHWMELPEPPPKDKG